MANTLEIQIKAHLEKNMDKKLERVAKVIIARMKLLLQGYIGRRSKLEQEIKYEIKNKKLKIYTDNLILGFFETGTKPHIIKPKQAEALRFRPTQGKKFGKFVFAKEVHHPGMDPRPVFSQALFLTEKEIVKILSE